MEQPNDGPALPDVVAEFYERLAKATKLALSPPRIEVGTTPHETIYEEGTMKLYHYLEPPQQPERKKRPPILLVYALINKPYIMDLQPGRSVVESLLRGGLDVYLIDWGTPTEMDRDLTVSDYVNGLMDHCVDKVREVSGEDSISILGYCMGGTFTSMYVIHHPEKVKRFALMAAPVAFESKGSFLNVWALAPGFDPKKIADAFGLVPPDFFNAGFALLDPLRTNYLKFKELLQRMDDQDFVENFLRMELWTIDGIPMAGPTFAEIVGNGYQRDMLVKGTWVLDGKTMKLSDITIPVAGIIGTFDNIVPPECTWNAIECMSSKEKIKFELPGGHVGLAVGGRAHKEMWPKVADWFLK
jgi:polyhydroxyalkanoate synthase